MVQSFPSVREARSDRLLFLRRANAFGGPRGRDRLGTPCRRGPCRILRRRRFGVARRDFHAAGHDLFARRFASGRHFHFGSGFIGAGGRRRVLAAGPAARLRNKAGAGPVAALIAAVAAPRPVENMEPPRAAHATASGRISIRLATAAAAAAAPDIAAAAIAPAIVEPPTALKQRAAREQATAARACQEGEGEQGRHGEFHREDS